MAMEKTRGRRIIPPHWQERDGGVVYDNDKRKGEIEQLSPNGTWQ